MASKVPSNLTGYSMNDVARCMDKTLSGQNAQSLFDNRPTPGTPIPTANPRVSGNSLRGWENYNPIPTLRVRISREITTLSGYKVAKRYYFYIVGGGNKILGFNGGIAQNSAPVRVDLNIGGTVYSSSVCSLRNDGNYSSQCNGEQYCLLFDLHEPQMIMYSITDIKVYRNGSLITSLSGAPFYFDTQNIVDIYK